MSDQFVSAVSQAISEQLSEMNTILPGVIESYDPVRNRAVVRPTMPKRLADGRDLPAPQIFEVPLVWLTSGGASVTMPVKPGDGVTLMFAQRSLDSWLSGGTTAPEDPRQFDLSDAIALPGLLANRPAVHPENLVMSFGEASISITPGGDVIIKANKVILDAPLTETPQGDIRAGDIALKTHRHQEQGDGNLTGPSRP